MYCVIVGDIVNSRELEPDVRVEVTRAAKEVFDRVNTQYGSSLMTNFGMVRGDAFEGVMLTQHYAPQIVQDILKAVYRVQATTLRVSVVLGQLTVTGADRNETDGPAFYTAMDNLKTLKQRGSKHWLQVSFDVGSPGQSLVESLFMLLTALTEGWTDKQREAVWVMEECGGSLRKAAERLNLSPSVVSKQLKAARYEAYRQAWDGLEDYLIAIDEYTVAEKPKPSYVTYFNLANRKTAQRDFPKAARLYEQALKQAKEDLQEDDPLLIPVYNGLAEACIFCGRYDQAEGAIQNSLKLQEKMPKARVQYAETLVIEANLYRTKEDWQKAKQKHREALGIARDTLEQDHPFIGAILNNLAVVYAESGDHSNAIELYKEALPFAKRNVNKQPLNYAVALYNMALRYSEIGQYAQALPYAEQALQMREENLPPNHEETIQSRNLLNEIQQQLEGEAQ
jgi:tetratricopeptide (TPR) repeat protein